MAKKLHPNTKILKDLPTGNYFICVKCEDVEYEHVIRIDKDQDGNSRWCRLQFSYLTTDFKAWEGNSTITFLKEIKKEHFIA